MLRITRSVLLTLCAVTFLYSQDEPPAQVPAVGRVCFVILLGLNVSARPLED